MAKTSMKVEKGVTVVMRDGRIVQAGPPVELYLRPRDAVTAAFLGDAVKPNLSHDDALVRAAAARMAVAAAIKRAMPRCESNIIESSAPAVQCGRRSFLS